MAKRGAFIVIEGLDRSGKTTQTGRSPEAWYLCTIIRSYFQAIIYIQLLSNEMLTELWYTKGYTISMMTGKPERAIRCGACAC